MRLARFPSSSMTSLSHWTADRSAFPYDIGLWWCLVYGV